MSRRNVDMLAQISKYFSLSQSTLLMYSIVHLGARPVILAFLPSVRTIFAIIYFLLTASQRVLSRTQTTTSTVATSEYFSSVLHTKLTQPCSRIDISDEFSFDHMLEFSKLAVAFAVELGGWTS